MTMGGELDMCLNILHQVNYHCNDGYDMAGDSTRRCEANGKWSGRLPRCIAVECVQLTAPMYGRLVGSGNAFGTLIRIECDVGFKLVGPEERRCQSDRQWSGRETRCIQIDCGMPEPFYNGYVLGQKTFVGAVMFFSCNERTNSDGTSFEATCQGNGEWSSPPPTCWGECEIPAIEGAKLFDGMAQGDWVRHLTRIKYKCGDGLVPDETNTAMCYNGTWKNMPRCVPSPCPSPPKHIDNGLRIYEGLKHGNRARYQCWNGYHLNGMNEGADFLVCEYGSWKGGNPTCDRLYCPNPGSLIHGKVYKKVLNGVFEFSHYITKIKHGIRIHFECDYGYARLGPSGATCVNGKWRPDLNKPGTKCVKKLHPYFPPQWIPVQEMQDH
ncbi:hypothetical protein KUTeg_022215 [Tegillarca granosa]|uniref:Sushi domain-containing protein n=1 Tax=Tegillarca granosa TaxID=220873 RepID=A0ABQ9E5L0_TEGGR|nr:hypothetical protein KUTeg_022215 [Tegillarca granosa]